MNSEKLASFFARVQLEVVLDGEGKNCSVSPRSSAALVSAQLTQFSQHASDGFSRSVRLVWRHRRRGVDGFGNDGSTPVKRIKEADNFGDGEGRRIEPSERRCALDQGNLGLPHSREIKLCLRDSA